MRARRGRAPPGAWLRRSLAAPLHRALAAEPLLCGFSSPPRPSPSSAASPCAPAAEPLHASGCRGRAFLRVRRLLRLPTGIPYASRAPLLPMVPATSSPTSTVPASIPDERWS
ncbi:unnamed protein product [Urochloa humidicola]